MSDPRRDRRGVATLLLLGTVAWLGAACEVPAPAGDIGDTGPDTATGTPDADQDADFGVMGDGGATADTDAGDADSTDAGDGDAATDGVADTEDTPADVDPTALRVRFDPDGTGFFDTPWPSDHRLFPDGTPDLSTFPGATVGIMPTFRAAIEHVVVGYSTMPAVYVTFEGPLEGVGFPQPSTTLRPGSAAQLLDVSESGCGRRVPVVVTVDAEGDPYRPANTLSATPVPGFVLDPHTPYAFVLRRELGREAGLHLARPDALDAALAGAGDPALAASLAPLVRCLASDPLALDDVAVATVFTTQDAATELRRVRDHVVDPSRVPAPVITEIARDTDASSETYATWRGTYDTPIYQQGVPPYPTGGAFAFVDGVPAIQRWEEVPFQVTVPLGSEGPFPVLVYMDGTGFRLRNIVRGQPVRDALAAGFAVASFAPQFHDTRAVAGSDPVVHGFNYLNPVAGRTVFRQQVVDTAYFVRVLREALDPELERGARVDPSTLVYGGHSQGGIIGTFVAGVESEFEAYVLNGTGTYISVTITRRVDPIDIPALIEQLFQVGRPIDEQHPLAAIVQLGSDVVEPHSYARYWRGHDARPSGSHVMVINGWNDTTTFPPSMDAMTIAGDLDVVAPAGWDVDPYRVWDRPSETEPPFAGNRVALDGSPLTFASFLDREGNHFVIRSNERVRDSAVRFWREALLGVPTVE